MFLALSDYLVIILAINWRVLCDPTPLGTGKAPFGAGPPRDGSVPHQKREPVALMGLIYIVRTLVPGRGHTGWSNLGYSFIPFSCAVP